MGEALSARQAAARCGVSERTLRRWIVSGRLAAAQENGAFRIKPEDLAPFLPQGRSAVATAAAIPLGAAELQHLQEADAAPLQQDAAAHWTRLVEQLHRENLELAGRLGFYQAENLQLKSQVQAMQVRILELEASKEAPAEAAPAEQNGPGSGSQALSEMCEQQPEAGRRSEVSVPSAIDGQEGSSGGAFKRFWRWLTQPI